MSAPKRKRITDKERLDWLTKKGGEVAFGSTTFSDEPDAWFVSSRRGKELAYGHDTPREALDAAIRASR